MSQMLIQRDVFSHLTPRPVRKFSRYSHLYTPLLTIIHVYFLLTYLVFLPYVQRFCYYVRWNLSLLKAKRKLYNFLKKNREEKSGRVLLSKEKGTGRR